jgi:NADH:ubiquinone oxidoreductase subunit K
MIAIGRAIANFVLIDSVEMDNAPASVLAVLVVEVATAEVEVEVG